MLYFVFAVFLCFVQFSFCYMFVIWFWCFLFVQVCSCHVLFLLFLWFVFVTFSKTNKKLFGAFLWFVFVIFSFFVICFVFVLLVLAVLLSFMFLFVCWYRTWKRRFYGIFYLLSFFFQYDILRSCLFRLIIFPFWSYPTSFPFLFNSIISHRFHPIHFIPPILSTWYPRAPQVSLGATARCQRINVETSEVSVVASFTSSGPGEGVVCCAGLGSWLASRVPLWGCGDGLEVEGQKRRKKGWWLVLGWWWVDDNRSNMKGYWWR